MPQRNSIFHNLGWKVVSLMLACLAWLTIYTANQKTEQLEKGKGEMTTTSIRAFAEVPITLLTSPTNTNRFTVNPELAFVSVGGAESELPKLQLSDVQAFVDLTETRDEKQFRRPVQIRVPRNFTVSSFAPSNALVERATSPK